jgi:predicted RNA methylase
MACSCPDVGLDEIFTEDFARRDADRYRKRGLPKRAQKLLQLIQSQLDLKGATALEGGAGAGALTVELARRGVSYVAAVDATSIALEYARQLAREYGVSERVEPVVADFADYACSNPADLVILDRVVCCYPDWKRLLENAATCARSVITLSYPADRLLWRVAIGTANTGQALLRRRFRMHFHAPTAMLAFLTDSGFQLVARERYWFWELAVMKRVG